MLVAGEELSYEFVMLSRAKYLSGGATEMRVYLLLPAHAYQMLRFAQHDSKSYALKFRMLLLLFHRDTFGQVAGLVYIAAAQVSDMISQKLQGQRS